MPSMSRPWFGSLLVAACAMFCWTGKVVAQESRPAAKTIAAEYFLPSNYPAEVRFDVATLTNIGMLDELRASPIWMLFAHSLNPMRFRVDEIDTLIFLADLGKGEGPRAVISGKPGVIALPGLKDDLRPRGFLYGKKSFHGTHENQPVVIETPSWGKPDRDQDEHWMWVSPSPGVVVYGPRHATEAALEGRTKRGIPAMHVFEMRGHKSLVSAVYPMTPEDVEYWSALLDSAAWRSSSNPLELVSARLTEPKEDQFQVHATFRFRKAGDEPKALAEAIRAQFASLAKDSSMRLIRGPLEQAVVEVSGLDVNLRCTLGDADQLIGVFLNCVVVQLGQMLRTLKATPLRVNEVRIGDVEVLQEVEAVPAPAPEKDGDG